MQSVKSKAHNTMVYCNSIETLTVLGSTISPDTCISWCTLVSLYREETLSKQGRPGMIHHVGIDKR